MLATKATILSGDQPLVKGDKIIKIQKTVYALIHHCWFWKPEHTPFNTTFSTQPYLH